MPTKSECKIFWIFSLSLFHPDFDRNAYDFSYWVFQKILNRIFKETTLSFYSLFLTELCKQCLIILHGYNNKSTVINSLGINTTHSWQACNSTSERSVGLLHSLLAESFHWTQSINQFVLQRQLIVLVSQVS